PENVAAYEALYAEYRELHDHFGRGASQAMHRLKRLQRAARSGLVGERTTAEPGTAGNVGEHLATERGAAEHLAAERGAAEHQAAEHLASEEVPA
ncbi:hypothetical protein, partial [Sinomonas sp. G460-2]|uniref:hypothetical protein n=1 Tax=Sinomonas sp. G460-2 TaxID=3393464 RepID=UPI0039EDFA2C